MLVERVPSGYLEALFASTVRPLVRGRTNAAGDATGVGTRQYERWFDVRHGKTGLRRRFVKLHAVIATRAQWPFFLSVRVTAGTWGDSPGLEPLVAQIVPEVELGNLALDKGYQSRRNAELIEAPGGLPVIALKSNVTRVKARGYPAWSRIVRRQFADPRGHRLRYPRRPVVEGLSGAFKRRFGERVKARRRHAQRVEILCRVVLWNLLGMAYQLG